MKVSVATPAHNEVVFLPVQLEAPANQDTQYEQQIMVVDSALTDQAAPAAQGQEGHKGFAEADTDIILSTNTDSQTGAARRSTDVEMIPNHDLELLYATHRAESFSRITRSLVRNVAKYPHNDEDGSQELASAALQKRRALEKKSALFGGGLAVSWLYEEAYVTPLDSSNSSKQHLIAGSVSMPETFGSNSMDQQAILDLIMRCIVEMPFRRREVAVRLMAGLTAKEIGLNLGIPPGTVRVHKVFLRRDLVKRLKVRGLEVKYYGKQPRD